MICPRGNKNNALNLAFKVGKAKRVMSKRTTNGMKELSQQVPADPYAATAKYLEIGREYHDLWYSDAVWGKDNFEEKSKAHMKIINT